MSRRRHSARAVQSTCQTSLGIWEHHLASTLSDGQIGSGKGSASSNKVSLTHGASVSGRAASCLRLPSLLFKMRRGDTILVYKILGGIDRSDPRAFFNRALNERARDHSQRLFVGRCRLEIRKNSFSQRSVVQDKNSLSEHVATATTLNSFKSKLDKYWKDDIYTTT